MIIPIVCECWLSPGEHKRKPHHKTVHKADGGGLRSHDGAESSRPGHQCQAYITPPKKYLGGLYGEPELSTGTGASIGLGSEDEALLGLDK